MERDRPAREPGRLGRAGQRGGLALSRPRAIPYLIVGTTSLLLSLGLIMVWSASSIYSIQNLGSSLATVAKQGLFAVLGVIALVIITRFPQSMLRRAAWPFLIFVIGLLILVLIPGIGIEVGGQRNWLGVGSTLRIQPSEFAKLALILWAADVLASRRHSFEPRRLLVPALPMGCLLIALVLAEGDFGNAMILAVILMGMLFVAGAPLRVFALSESVGLVGVVILAWMAPYRVERFTAFLNADADRLDSAWQVNQGMVALGTGGVFGAGLGESREKWGTLPAAHTDFIFTVLGEELGLVGTTSVLLLFALLVFAILRLVHLTPDRFVQAFSAGLAVWLMIQVVTNIGATLKMLPITGVTLPFLSYGGSSLIPILMGIGMVLVLARRVVHGEPRFGVRRSGRNRRGSPAEALDLRADPRLDPRLDPRADRSPDRSRPTRST